MGVVADESMDAATWVAVLSFRGNGMNLEFNLELADNYKSNSQIARVLTEGWVKQYSFCPKCGEDSLSAFENNRPVADFYCTNCSSQFELKSKASKTVGHKIVDGAYNKMVERVQSEENPHFFFLTYDKVAMRVHNYLIIPNYYFTPDIIEKRKPLKETAKRAGWVGCNINLTKIPESGRIFIVKNAEIVKKEQVLNRWNATSFLNTVKYEKKGWLLDIMNCIDAIPKLHFSLQDMYAFVEGLQMKHPDNHFIKDKIRQQLQLLRDKGFIEFLGSGQYKKVNI